MHHYWPTHARLVIHQVLSPGMIDCEGTYPLDLHDLAWVSDALMVAHAPSAMNRASSSALCLKTAEEMRQGKA
eukprot:2850448-Rhodomonas_salina.1